jgi:hypothetical protein
MVGLLHCGSVPISVTIKDTSGAGRVVTSVTLDGINDRITLRDLVRTRVREEVASAQVRREVLAQLVPKLAIADRCTLEDRYLVVRGDLRTYRIHLGSGNILMSPNDQYLCIVPALGGQAGELFLPFDDDQVLSLILSKAFLLAADATITDPLITSQIRLREAGR